MVLGRSLMELRDLVDSTLSEVRLDAGIQRRERLAVAEFLDEIAVVAHLHAEYRGDPPLGGARAPRVGRERGPPDPRVRGDEPPEQRLQVHGAGRSRRAQGAGRRRARAPRGGRRVWRHSGHDARPVPGLRRAARQRPDGSRPGALHCPKGRDAAGRDASTSATCRARAASSSSTSPWHPGSRALRGADECVNGRRIVAGEAANLNRRLDEDGRSRAPGRGARAAPSPPGSPPR